MSRKIRLAIIGCGGMGHRHLYGLEELRRIGRDRFELVGACDPVRENAEFLVDYAAKDFGTRPVVVSDLDGLAALGVEAVSVTTTPQTHHLLVVETLNRGWHTMVEKPMGVTVRACNLIWRTAENANAILSVAENYRRDPINRLARALLNADVIGDPRFLIHHSVGGRDQMLITEWRHQKNQGGLLLDVGVHFTDMMEYLLGEIETVYAKTRLHERIRKNPAVEGGIPESNPSRVYEHWQKQMPAEFEASAEDAAYATLTFKNGVVGQYIEDHAGYGENLWTRRINGSRGSMILPQDRSGGTITLNIEGDNVICDETVLDLVPDFHLDAITADLFGGDRLWCYQFPFPETDRKNIAIEYGNFAESISGKGNIEVDAEQGTRSVAVSYAMLESNGIGYPVSVDEVISEHVDAYQQEINESLGILK